MKQVFEYKIVNLKDVDLAVLNTAGKDGWELVAVVPETDSYYGFAYLKRAQDSKATALLESTEEKWPDKKPPGLS